MTQLNHQISCEVEEILPDFFENLISEYESRLIEHQEEEELPFPRVSLLLCADCGYEVEYNSAEYLTNRFSAILCVDCCLERLASLDDVRIDYGL